MEKGIHTEFTKLHYTIAIPICFLLSINQILISALLVTGGINYDNDGDASLSAEIIHPDGSTCSMPDLPASAYHTQTGLSACGGWDWDFCRTFTAGQWETTHHLAIWRTGHVSWKSPIGTVLIGGYYHPDAYQTAILLSSTGNNGSIIFNLPYPTR